MRSTKRAAGWAPKHDSASPAKQNLFSTIDTMGLALGYQRARLMLSRARDAADKETTTMTPNTLTDSALVALTSGSGDNLDVVLARGFRAALVAAGYGDTDTSEIPDTEWNKALDAVVG